MSSLARLGSLTGLGSLARLGSLTGLGRLTGLGSLARLGRLTGLGRLAGLGALCRSRDDGRCGGLLGGSGGGSLLSRRGGLLGRLGRGLDNGGRSTGLRLAVELDLVDLDLAELLEKLGLLLGEADADLLSTTALSVYNSRTLARAGGGVLARRAISHSVVEVKAGIDFRSDRVAVNGEGSDVVTGRDGRVVVLVVGAAFTDNGLATKGASGQGVVTSEELILTGPAFEVASSEEIDFANGKKLPIIARNLLLFADNRGLTGASIAADVVPVLEATANDAKLEAC